MSYPHRIRLRGPWECEVPAGAAPRRLALPCAWEQLVPPGFVGAVRLQRRFGYPGRIDESEHVWLTATGLVLETEVALNGQALTVFLPLPPEGEPSPVRGRVITRPLTGLGSPGLAEVEITSLLGPRNRLDLTLAVEAPTGPVWEEIALEIRKDAFLRAAARRVGAEVEVSGVVVGSAAGALDLYALVAGRNLHYQSSAAGQSFRFILALDAGCTSVQLELVQGAVCWYALHVPVMAGVA